MVEKQQSSQAQLVIFSSIGCAVLLLTFILFVFDKAGEPSFKPIKLATGEWAPYSSSQLPEYGIVSAIVSHVLKQMGYQPDYQFMPWSSAESNSALAESDDGIRGVFPYSDPKDNPESTSDRHARFYFSDSIMSIEIGVFYDARYNPQAASLSSPEQLANFELVLLDGYEYPPQFTPYLNHQGNITKLSNSAAFEMFNETNKPLLVIESIDVGKNLIESQFPSLLPYIKVAPLKVGRDVKLMLAKRNPNNLSLLRRFNKALAAFKKNESAYEQFINKVRNNIELARAVELEPKSGEDYILGFASPKQEQSIMLPKGSKAVVRQWSDSFLKMQPSIDSTSASLVRVKLLNGPFASANQDIYVSPASIKLPSTQKPVEE